MNKKLPIKRFDTQYFKAWKIYVFVQLIGSNQLINTNKIVTKYAPMDGMANEKNIIINQSDNNQYVWEIHHSIDFRRMYCIELWWTVQLHIVLSANFNAVHEIGVVAVFNDINMLFTN